MIPFKRILAVYSITCTVLYIACWVGEAVHATRERMEGSQPHEEAPQKPLTDRIKENVQQQIEEIRRVDARDLGFTFFYDLKMWDCNWRIHCLPSKVAVGYTLHELRSGPRGPFTWPQQNHPPIIFDSAAKSLRLEGGNLFSGQASGGADKKLADRWHSFKLPPPTHVWAIPDPNITQQENKASAPTPAGSKVAPLKSPDSGSTAPKETSPWTPPAPRIPIAKQPQALPTGTSDPATELEVQSKTLLLPETRNPADDEPPTPEELSFAINSPEPKLLVKGPIPSLHTVLGIPRATFVTIRAILRAGPWAITIFITCGILYFGGGAPLIAILLRDRGSKDWDALTLTLIVLLFVSPVAVPCIVGGVQSAAAALGNAFSWMLGLWVVVAAQSAAIGVLVGIPHLVKSPREVKEAYHVIRHGVEAIEKE